MGQPGCNTTKPTTSLYEPYEKPYLSVDCKDCDEDCIHVGNTNKCGHWSNGFCGQYKRNKGLKK